MYEDTEIQGDRDSETLHLSDEYVAVAVEVFRLLADPTRLRIIAALHQGEKSVNALAELTSRNPASVSQHLAKLRLTKMVLTRQEGNRIFYRLANEHASHLVSEALRQAEHALDDQPAHHS